ncbi:MAG: DUF1284 domain-containing protein [Pseudomonadota bacterium]
MSIRLRGHHLLCLLTYKGEGYTPRFIENYDAVASQLSAGAPFEIIEGPDDICAPLLAESACAHCVKDRIRARDQLALEELETAGFNFSSCRAFTFNKNTLSGMREAFAKSRIRGACVGCEWHGFCTQVAADGYNDTKLTV